MYTIEMISQRQPGPTANEITSVCFRVTRACNLRCSYCQAPPNAKQLSPSELSNALKSLACRGTRRVKFTGGEPFLYHGILNLVEQCRALGMEPTIVTNGTMLPPGSLECLRKCRARVKISLHGPREVHNRLQGQEVYEDVVATIKTLIGVGIETSIHTLLHRGSNLDLDAWILTSLPADVTDRQTRATLPAWPPGKERHFATDFAPLLFGAARFKRASWARVIARRTVTEKPIHRRASDSGFHSAAHAAAAEDAR